MSDRDQLLRTRFRALDAIVVGPEPSVARDRLRSAVSRRTWSQLRTVLAATVAMAAAVVFGLALGSGVTGIRTQPGSPDQIGQDGMLRELDLPAGLSSVHIQLSPDGRFVSVVSRDFGVLQILELSESGDLVARAELRGEITDARWRDDSSGVLVQLARSDRVRDQNVDLHLLGVSGVQRLLSAQIPKGSQVASAAHGEDLAVMQECCPRRILVSTSAIQTSLDLPSGIASLIGWDRDGRLLYAVNGRIKIWGGDDPSAEIVLAGAPEGVGLLGWSPDRSAVVIGAGRPDDTAYYVVRDGQARPITDGVPTGLWSSSSETLILSGQDIVAVDAATGGTRLIAPLSDRPEVIWGVAAGHLLWSADDLLGIRQLDLTDGTEVQVAVPGRLGAVLVAPGPGRFLVIGAEGRPLIGKVE